MLGSLMGFLLIRDQNKFALLTLDFSSVLSFSTHLEEEGGMINNSKYLENLFSVFVLDSFKSLKLLDHTIISLRV